MAPHLTLARGVYGPGIAQRYFLALGAALLLLGGSPLMAQEANLSVASQVGQGCGAAISTPALQQDVESQLREAGIGVSRVHSAALTTDVDCVPVYGGASAGGVAVHLCLSLSQVVSMPSHSNGMAMATTWRQCQGYTCAGGQCGTYARTSQRGLVDAFLADFRARAARQGRSAESQRESGGQSPLQASFAAPPDLVSKLSVVFYALYIVTCLVVFVRWQMAR